MPTMSSGRHGGRLVMLLEDMWGQAEPDGCSGVVVEGVTGALIEVELDTRIMIRTRRSPITSS